MSYSAIADTGNLIVKILREALVPEFVPNESSIGLASPGNHEDLWVTVFLYDISESNDIRLQNMTNIGNDKLGFPKSYLDLHYMITVFSDADVKYKSMQEHRILGKIYQTLRDIPIIPISKIRNIDAKSDYGIQIYFEQLPIDTKYRAWPDSTRPYQLSVFFCAKPIGIDSTRTKDIKRVMEVDFTINDDKYMIKTNFKINKKADSKNTDTNMDKEVEE